MLSLKKLLSRSSSDMTKDRAKRLVRAGSTASQKQVDAALTARDKKAEQIEDLLDLSARVDLNEGQGKLSSEDITNSVQKLHSMHQELFVLNRKLEIAEDLHTSLMGG